MKTGKSSSEISAQLKMLNMLCRNQVFLEAKVVQDSATDTRKSGYV